MDFKNTYTKRGRAAFTLVELLVGVAIGGILMAAVASLMFYTGRSFAAMANYVELDAFSRNALDQMSREIRQTSKMTAASATNIVFEDYDGSVLEYRYNADERTLRRYRNGAADGNPLLEQCDYLHFGIFQRNPVAGTYDQYPAASPDTCKLVQLRWLCSRDLIQSKFNTESVQSAKIVIRKQ